LLISGGELQKKAFFRSSGNMSSLTFAPLEREGFSPISRTNVDSYLFSWGGLGCALAFLALCKVCFVPGNCAPYNVLKIAWGSVGKVSGCVKQERCVQ